MRACNRDLANARIPDRRCKSASACGHQTGGSGTFRYPGINCASSACDRLSFEPVAVGTNCTTCDQRDPRVNALESILTVLMAMRLDPLRTQMRHLEKVDRLSHKSTWESDCEECLCERFPSTGYVTLYRVFFGMTFVFTIPSCEALFLTCRHKQR